MVSAAPDWSLIREIVRRIEADPCGGIHRAALAARFGLPAYGPSMKHALMIAWTHKKVDFCGQYVVRPAVRSAR